LKKKYDGDTFQAQIEMTGMDEYHRKLAHDLGLIETTATNTGSVTASATTADPAVAPADPPATTADPAAAAAAQPATTSARAVAPADVRVTTDDWGLVATQVIVRIAGSDAPDCMTPFQKSTLPDEELKQLKGAFKRAAVWLWEVLTRARVAANKVIYSDVDNDPAHQTWKWPPLLLILFKDHAAFSASRLIPLVFVTSGWGDEPDLRVCRAFHRMRRTLNIVSTQSVPGWMWHFALNTSALLDNVHRRDRGRPWASFLAIDILRRYLHTDERKIPENSRRMDSEPGTVDELHGSSAVHQDLCAIALERLAMVAPNLQNRQICSQRCGVTETAVLSVLVSLARSDLVKWLVRQESGVPL
jgi:hypothetical protein